MIELNNISKSFGSKTLYNGLSFKIEKNDFFAILGKSGTGKSTLLNIISFFDFITDGTYLFDSTLITKKNTSFHSLVRNEKIGFIFQNYNLLDGYTSLDNIMLPTLYSKKKFDKSRLDVLVQRLDISAILNQKVDLLSGGEKQRVAIARALLIDPAIIIADEPTGNLDNKNADFVMNILKNEHQNGKTIIFVTHTNKYESLYTNSITLEESKNSYFVQDENNKSQNEKPQV